MLWRLCSEGPSRLIRLGRAFPPARGTRCREVTFKVLRGLEETTRTLVSEPLMGDSEVPTAANMRATAMTPLGDTSPGDGATLDADVKCIGILPARGAYDAAARNSRDCGTATRTARRKSLENIYYFSGT